MKNQNVVIRNRRWRAELGRGEFVKNFLRPLLQFYADATSSDRLWDQIVGYIAKTEFDAMAPILKPVRRQVKGLKVVNGVLHFDLQKFFRHANKAEVIHLLGQDLLRAMTLELVRERMAANLASQAPNHRHKMVAGLRGPAFRN